MSERPEETLDAEERRVALGWAMGWARPEAWRHMCRFDNTVRAREECIERLAQQKDDALSLLHRYGGIDGGHHKEWLLDQVLRALTGDQYENWVHDWSEGGEYEWPEGIAP